MRDAFKHSNLSGCIVAITLFFAVMPAASQSRDAATAIEKAHGLEEIIVTARKREESLQEVPLSITAITGQGLRDKNITSTYQLANATPNFNLGRNLGRRLDAPTIRGQFGTLLNTTGPNASFFVDGVYVTETSSNLSSNYVERVEILRGPQAALFGRATFSGAINYITRKPSNELEGQFNFRAGSHETLEGSGWVSGPIIDDTLLFFASAGIQQYGGEWRNNLQPGDVNTTNDPALSQDFFNGPFIWSPNVPTGNEADCPSGYRTASGETEAGCPFQGSDNTKLGGEETIDFSGKLLWNIGDSAEITAKIDYIETHDDHFPALFLPIDSLNCFRPADSVSGFDGDANAGVASPGWFCGELGPGLTVPSKLNLPDYRTGVTTRPPGSGIVTSTPAPFIGSRSETTRYLLQGVFDIKEWELTTRAAYTDNSDGFVRDLDRTYALGPVTTGLFEQYSVGSSEDKSFEARIASPANKKVYGMFGYYYYKTESLGKIRDFNGFAAVNFRQYENTSVVNNAFFGSINVDIIDGLSASIEARYAKDTPTSTKTPDANGDIVTANENFYSFTPRYTIKYQPTDQLNFYALAAKGNKPGGYNTFAFFDADTANTDTLAALGENDCLLTGQQPICSRGVIEEEKAWTYEIGAKTRFLNDRLTLNGALYYIDWTNQQVNITVEIPTNCSEPPGPTDPLRNCILQTNNIVDNVGKSSVYGVELEANWFATDNLSFTLAYGMAKSKLEGFSDPTLAELRCSAECWETTTPGEISPLTDNALALRAQLGDVDGNQSPRAPEHSLNIGGAYTRPFGSHMEWFLRSDVTYETKQYATVANLTYTDEPIIWNTWTGLRSDNWTVSFYIDNILDDDTSVLNNDFPLFDLSKTTQTGAGPGSPLTRPAPFNTDIVLPTGYLVTPRRGRNAGVTLQISFGG
jgi:iron complex outermembrane receptor protein